VTVEIQAALEDRYDEVLTDDALTLVGRLVLSRAVHRVVVQGG